MLTFRPAEGAKSAVARCAVAQNLNIAVAIDPPRGILSGREAKRNVRRRGGGILAHRTVRSVRGCLWVDVPLVTRPTGWSPDAPSQSNVDGTVAQCAVAVSIRDVVIDVVGTHL